MISEEPEKEDPIGPSAAQRPHERPRHAASSDRVVPLLAAVPGLLTLLVAVAVLRYKPSDVFTAFAVVVLALVALSASVPLLSSRSRPRRRSAAVLLVGIVASSALATTIVDRKWIDTGTPPAPAPTSSPSVPSPSPSATCKSWANFGSPKPGQLVKPETEIYGRGFLCDGYYLWVVTRSTNGEYVSRMREPISVNAEGNWVDPLPAVFGKNPPPRFTYCLMATDEETTIEWRNKFKPIDEGKALDLTGLEHPQRCLSEVTVRTNGGNQRQD